MTAVCVGAERFNCQWVDSEVVPVLALVVPLVTLVVIVIVGAELRGGDMDEV